MHSLRQRQTPGQQAKLRGKRQPITFTLPPDLIAEIDAVAAAEDRSRAKMIEIGMRQFVQSYNRRAAA